MHTNLKNHAKIKGISLAKPSPVSDRLGVP